MLASPPPARWAGARGPALVAIGALAAWTYLALVDPNSPGHYPLCPFRALTGLSCPGCGSLRAMHDLAHGQFGQALARNPLTVLALPLVAWAWLAWLRRSWTGRPRANTLPPWLIWSAGVVVVAFWVLRNLPGIGWLGP